MTDSSIRALERLGADVRGNMISGSYFLRDNHVSLLIKKVLERSGAILMDLKEARSKVEWLRRYYWRALSPGADKFTKLASETEENGVVLYVPRGTKIKLPIQSCFLISKPDWEQVVHNVVVVDEGAEVTLNTVCAAVTEDTLHVGVTEMYVGKGAKLNYVMIHGWRESSEARPRTGAVVEEGGVLNMYYVNLRPVSLVQSSPVVRLNVDSSVNITSILLGLGGSRLEVGSKVELSAEGASAEIVSRSIARDESRIRMLGELVGMSSGARGHLECKGLQLSDRAVIEAIPILRSESEDVELTHEAAIGRLSEEGLYYLMSKGFSEEEATSMMIRGFVDVGLETMPPAVRPQISTVLNLIAKYGKG